MSGRVDQQPAWRALAAHPDEIGKRHLPELFAADPGRGERLVIHAAGLHLDYAKNRVSDETMRLLVKLARGRGVRERTAAMGATALAGEPIPQVLAKAPGNGTAIGDIKVITASGWFAARPSGTEDIHKIYAESFASAQHLQRLLKAAQAVVDRATAAPSRRGT